MKPWICPKCGRVYSGLVFECRHCNARPVTFSSTQVRHPSPKPQWS